MTAVLRTAFTFLVLSLSTAFAQQYPTQRIQILVPFSAGTVLDTLARVAADEFSAEFKQPVVIVNRPGAAGVLAFGDVAAAAPDGHTLIFAGQTQLTVQPHIKSDLPYKVEDITPICQMFETPFALIVSRNSPYKDFAEFAAAARAKPGAITFGHSGAATTPHLLGAMLGKSAGFQMTEVPYRVLGDQIKDVTGGMIDAMVLSIGSFSPEGVRAIAVFNRRRSATFPDVPTVAELGHPLRFRSINGLFAPRGLPAATLTRLGDACRHAFDSAKFRDMAARLDVNAEFVAGDEFARRIVQERNGMKTLIDTLGLKPQ